MNELTKDESKILKGIAILFMIGLHLYNRIDIENYYNASIMINNNPLIYYISFIFDACVPIYCFCAGYAAYINQNKSKKSSLIKLLINYWVILILTCILGLLLKDKSIPGNIFDFLSNAFLYNISYVGAWWFMQTYVLLTLTSTFLINFINKVKSLFILILVLFIYVVAYYFRIIHPITNYQLIINPLVLYGTSVFPYIMGIMFRKHNIISIIRNKITKYSSFIGICIIILCVFLHIVIKSMFIAPFIAIVLICGYSLLHIDGIVKKILLFFGKHSTNIWLTHMQFYMIFFSKIVFCTKTVLGCFVILICMCLISSFFINTLIKIINKKISTN